MPLEPVSKTVIIPDNSASSTFHVTRIGNYNTIIPDSPSSRTFHASRIGHNDAIIPDSPAKNLESGSKDIHASQTIHKKCYRP
jgi:hypothetical protein